MDKLIESIGQAIAREMQGKADIQAILFKILKDFALKLEELERRIKAIENR